MHYRRLRGLEEFDVGYGRFAVVGHDRGARCAYRLALNHPRAVAQLAVLDIVPTGDAYRRADADFSLGFGCGRSWRRRLRCRSGSSPARPGS
jgi:pimeloyl-ACP methyl ester carboxylesterase